MIRVVNYNAGNTRSLMNRLDSLGIAAELSADPDQLIKAEKIIFPGVGAAKPAMESLREAELIECLQSYQNPFLGICLGMQLMGEYSEEGEQSLLALLDFQVHEFKDVAKIPHMGWNSIYDLKGPLFKNLEDGSDMYFVHSFHVQKLDISAASSRYGGEFSAALQKDNYFACQFHPEKSGKKGSLILQNFDAL